MRKIVLLFLFACLAVTQVQADYFYKLRLNTITDGGGTNYSLGWTSWILVQSGDERKYSLENLYNTVNGGSSFTVKDVSNNTYIINRLDQITGFAAKGRDDNNILDGEDRKILVENLHTSIMVLDLKEWKETTLSGSYYFANMSNVKKLILPDHDIAIGDDYEFSGWNSLESIEFTHNCTSIGKNAFRHCHSLPSQEVQKLLVGCTSIGEAAFYEGGKITTLTIPNTVTTIGNQAFEACTALTDVTFTGTDADKVRLSSLGEKAFKDCYELVNFNLQTETPNFTSMGDYCFERCHKLSTTAVNSNILPRFKGTTINQGVFRCCCTGLTEVNIPRTITTIKNKGFHGTNALATLIFDDRDGTLTIENSRAFSPEPNEDNTYNEGTHKTTALTTVTFGNGTYSIGDAAFMKAYNLQTINVGVSTVISKIGQCVFGDCRPLTSASVNALLSKAQSGLTVEHYAFYGCSGGNLKHIDIPATITTLQSGCFGMSEYPSTIDNITVHNATPPTLDRSPNTFQASGDSNYMTNGTDSIFRKVRPNYVTIYFKDGAASVTDTKAAAYAYMEATGNNAEWKDMLTKTLSSTNTTYDVYPQQHAIVKLTRPLKAGWNTLCLPFAVNYAIKELGGQRQNTEILKDALNANNGNSFKLAVYRGYYKNKDLFRFLNYAKFETDPIDAFEAFMVHMDKQDLADDNVYTFTNVDLNYHYSSADVNKNFDTANPWIYNGTDPSTGAKRGAVPLKEFNGRLNTDVKPFNDGNSNYDDYVFRGSYVQIVESVSDNPTPVSQSLTKDNISVLKESSNTDETSANLIDGKTSTKYCTDKGSGDGPVAWIVYHLPEAKAVTAYSITSANDEPGRDPKNWKLQGSNDGNTWTDLDTQSDQKFSDRYETKKYMVYGGASYKYYRLYITATYQTDNTMIQLSEWTLEGTNLSVKDAFIQNTDNRTYFYHCKANKKYGVRGFCGWFKYVGSESVAAASKAMIPAAFYDGEFDGEPTAIVFFDSNGNEQPAYYDVYTLGGQQVRSHAASLAGLPKGLYIVNGKKVVVK